MIIDSISIYSYSLKLNQPLYARGSKLHQREGLIIHLKSDTNHESFGEIAPLVGLNKENLGKVKQQALTLKSYLVNQSIPDKIEMLDGKFENWLNEFDLVPSAQFGIEMAILNLIANSKNLSLNQLLNASSEPNIKIHALLTGKKDEIVAQAIKLMQQGFTSMKLKVGGCPIEEDIEKVKSLHKAVEHRVLLHCDANQSWDFDTAMTFGNALGCGSMAYIEEPFKDISRIPEFFNASSIPVALDESLQYLTFADIKHLEGIEYLILKPTFFGGIEKVYQIIKQAEQLAINTIISSCYESSLGILTLAQLAGGLMRHNTSGLDTIKYFKEDLLKNILRIEKGKINFDRQALQSQDINFDLLTKL